MAAKLVRPTVKNTCLFLCDMQEKFRPNISCFPAIINVSKRMRDAADILKIPIVVTEQYPKGLGPTVSELNIDKSKTPVFEKTCFSMVIKSVEDLLKSDYPERRSVILCGIETHACIFQTAMDLLDREFDVHLVVDGSSSRSQVERMFAIRSLERAGVTLVTSERILLSLLQDSAHPNFKAVQKLIMDVAPDSQLLNLPKC